MQSYHGRWVSSVKITNEYEDERFGMLYGQALLASD